MAGSLGSASFSLDADNTQLVGAFVQAQAKAQQASAAIQAAVAAQTKAIQSGSAAAVQAAAAQTQAAQGAIQAAQQASARFKEMGGASQQAAGGFGDLLKSGIGLSAGLTGVTLGLDTVRASMERVAQVTQQARQAQFELDATYKASAATYTSFTQQQAEAIKRTNTEVQQSVSAFGSLSNRYAINTDQVKELTKRSADLAAVKGITGVEAAKRLEAALRGEAESAEFLGLTLNSDYMKKFAVMTAEQRKNWETLDPLIKAQITYAEVLRQTDPLLGTAAKRSKEAVGAYDALKTSTDNLALSIGNVGTHGTGASLVGSLAEAVDWMSRTIDRASGAKKALDDLAGATAGIQIGPDAGMPGAGRPTPGQLAALDAGRKSAMIREAENRDRVKHELEAADKANDATAESAIKAIDRERKAKDVWYAEERQRIEARRTYQIEDIEARRDAAIAGIQAAQQAQKDADRDEIDRLQRAKDLDERTIAEAHDRTVAALDARRKEFEADRERESRETADQRQAESRALKDAREQEDHGRETGHRDEMRREDARHQQAIDDLKDEQERDDKKTQAALRNIDHQIKSARARSAGAIEGLDDEIRAVADREAKRKRALDELGRSEDDLHRTNLSNLDERGRAEDELHRNNVDGIQAEIDAEGERHRQASENLKAEEDQRLGIVDAQLAALDAQEKAADQAERMADLQQKVADAEAALAKTRGSGTPDQIKQAEADVLAAIRRGDDNLTAIYRSDLAALAGDGAEAVEKAERELADARADLAKENVDQTRDAERAKLKAVQDGIRAEIAARQRAEDEQARIRSKELAANKDAEDDRSRMVKVGLALDKSAEDERSRLVKVGLDRDKQASEDRASMRRRDLEEDKRAEQAKLDSRISALETRKEKLQEAGREEAEQIRQRIEDENTAHEHTVLVANDDYQEQTRLLNIRREDEDRALADRRESEDRARADRQQAEDADLARQRAVADAAQQAMRQDLEAHYNGPNGVLTQAKAASEEHERQFSRQLAAARAAYEQERKDAELIYTNPEGTGLLQNLEKARASEHEKLDASKNEWQEWAKAASAAIKAAMADLDAFISKGANIPRMGGDKEAQRSPGSGKLTSSSEQETRSGRTGKVVRGDVSSWLNDAIDITGVPDDWIVGLSKLVQLESGGDPHNQNSQDVIDPSTGKNLGKAKGLLQMLQSTFDANRNKKLPDDIFDPVANAVASINYIKGRYGHVDAAVKNHAARGGYAEGGWIPEPVFGIGRSGRSYSFAEYGPEYVNSIADSSKMLKGGNQGGVIDEDRLARAIARAMPRSDTFNLIGTSEDLLARAEARQALRDAMTRPLR